MKTAFAFWSTVARLTWSWCTWQSWYFLARHTAHGAAARVQLSVSPRTYKSACSAPGSLAEAWAVRCPWSTSSWYPWPWKRYVRWEAPATAPYRRKWISSPCGRAYSFGRPKPPWLPSRSSPWAAPLAQMRRRTSLFIFPIFKWRLQISRIGLDSPPRSAWSAKNVCK